MTERKMHDTENGRTENGRTENGRKYTYWKMAEKEHPENGRTENARYGKWQNKNGLTWKMAKYTHTGKWQKMHARKITEQKMHDTENGRTVNAQYRKWQKMHVLENGRKSTTGK